MMLFVTLLIQLTIFIVTQSEDVDFDLSLYSNGIAKEVDIPGKRFVKRARLWITDDDDKNMKSENATYAFVIYTTDETIRWVLHWYSNEVTINGQEERLIAFNETIRAPYKSAIVIDKPPKNKIKGIHRWQLYIFQFVSIRPTKIQILITNSEIYARRQIQDLPKNITLNFDAPTDKLTWTKVNWSNNVSYCLRLTVIDVPVSVWSNYECVFPFENWTIPNRIFSPNITYQAQLYIKYRPSQITRHLANCTFRTINRPTVTILRQLGYGQVLQIRSNIFQKLNDKFHAAANYTSMKMKKKKKNPRIVIQSCNQGSLTVKIFNQLESSSSFSKPIVMQLNKKSKFQLYPILSSNQSTALVDIYGLNRFYRISSDVTLLPRYSILRLAKGPQCFYGKLLPKSDKQRQRQRQRRRKTVVLVKLNLKTYKAQSYCLYFRVVKTYTRQMENYCRTPTKRNGWEKGMCFEPSLKSKNRKREILLDMLKRGMTYDLAMVTKRKKSKFKRVLNIVRVSTTFCYG